MRLKIYRRHYGRNVARKHRNRGRAARGCQQPLEAIPGTVTAPAMARSHHDPLTSRPRSSVSLGRKNRDTKTHGKTRVGAGSGCKGREVGLPVCPRTHQAVNDWQVPERDSKPNPNPPRRNLSGVTL